MRAGVVGAMVCGLVGMEWGTARAEETFEQKAQGAKPLSDTEAYIWSYAASCESNDDVAERQCKFVQAHGRKEFAGKRLVVADREALVVGAWDAKKKSVALELKSCVRCAAAIRARSGAPLHDRAQVVADEVAAKALTAALANARIEVVIEAPERRPGKQPHMGVVVDVVAWRVISPCDGKVVISSVPSGPVPADKAACKK